MDEPNDNAVEKASRRWGGTIAAVACLAALAAVAIPIAMSQSSSQGTPNEDAAGLATDETDEMCAPSADGFVLSGWGDTRPMYEAGTAPDHLTFNSARGNEVVGDERNWVRIRTSWTNAITV